MHVAIDQSRQNEIAADIKRRSAVRRCRRRAFADNRNLPVGDADIDNTTIGEPAIVRRASWPHSWRGMGNAAEGAERSLDHRRIEPPGDE